MQPFGLMLRHNGGPSISMNKTAAHEERIFSWALHIVLRANTFNIPLQSQLYDY